MRREGNVIVVESEDIITMFSPYLGAIRGFMGQMDDEHLPTSGRSIVIPLSGSTIFGLPVEVQP